MRVIGIESMIANIRSKQKKLFSYMKQFNKS